MSPLAWLAQAATEYGALTGNAAAQVGSGPSTLADQALDFVFANPVAVGIAVLTIVIVTGFARTGRYRS